MSNNLEIDGFVQASKTLCEKRDCVVFGIAAALGKSYFEVHGDLTARGRKRRKGTHKKVYFPYLNALGFKAVARTGTLERFIKDNPEGRFLVRITDHLTIVNNGVVLDRFPISHGCRVRHYWRVA